jgi:Cu-Zn family superoxide dismutase
MRLFLNAILNLFLASFPLAGSPAAVATATATINSISATGVGTPLGTVIFADSTTGLLITPKFSGLPPGEHGFHIHEKGECGPGMNQGKPAAGVAAGGHYDPGHTKKHLGPLSTAGHRGDQPVLVIDNRGDATEAVTAPHPKWRRFATARSWFMLAAIIIPTLRRRWAVEVRALVAA